jgi:hypothetical protein
MSHHDDHLHDADLGPVIARLQAERPTASDLELGLIEQRVRGRVAPSARRSRRTEFMRSRLAIIAMLVFGMVLSTGGGALAVSGFAAQDNAAVAQYGESVGGQDVGGQDVKGEEESGGNGVLGEGNETGAPAGGTEANGSPAGGQEANGVQPARQVEAGAEGTGGDQQLPFTGFAAIPILLGGVALLVSGLVLRRRAAGLDA